VLDALRQPLESGRLAITRVGGTAVYPARFLLLLAANPCPCARPDDACSCPPNDRRRYLARLSGPLLDRVDMHVVVPRITRAEMMAEDGRGEPSADIAARVLHARSRAAERFAGTPWRTNGQVPAVELRRRWPLPRVVTEPAENALERGQLTARGFGRVLRLAWTLADLQDAGRPGPEHVSHALGFRLGNAHEQVAA
jgi:magnesium chelatase family protein